MTTELRTGFAVELRRAMETRGISYTHLQRLTGIAAPSVAYYLSGERVPTLQRADLLADVLDWGQLRKSAIVALRRRCHRCSRQFLANAKNRNGTLYCSKTCRSAVSKARASRTEISQRRQFVTRVERTLDEFCRTCEPEGFCRDADCPIQREGLSPLPFVPLTDVSHRTPAPNGVLTHDIPRLQSAAFRTKGGDTP